MAPNVKQRPLILQAAVNLDLVKSAAFPPLTSEVAQQNNVLHQETLTNIPQANDSSDYWEWSANNDAEIQRLTAEEEAARLVSAEHIVDNILRQPAAAATTRSTTAANDQYWDWSHAQTESVDYWNWPVANNGQRPTTPPASEEETDAYWAW